MDLRNTLLIRGAEAVAVDFYALVARNDLTQNVLIEPGGTIYVPSSLAREVHVLGEVEVPRRGRAPHQLPECPRRTSRAGGAR